MVPVVIQNVKFCVRSFRRYNARQGSQMPTIMAQKESEKYPLHRCIFQGDVKTLNTLIRTHDIIEKDKQGLFQHWSKNSSLFSVPEPAVLVQSSFFTPHWKELVQPAQEQKTNLLFQICFIYISYSRIYKDDHNM